MNHTLGPWHVVNGPKGQEIRSAHGTDIAEVYSGTLTYGERNANARVLSAAPDLLHCCKIALAAFEKNHCIDWAELEQAIAKAEGDRCREFHPLHAEQCRETAGHYGPHSEHDGNTF